MRTGMLKRAAVRSARAAVLKTGPRKTPPLQWKKDYPIIEELRTVRDAPVDYVGCERLADPKASKRDFQWQCLVAAMLSSQTKDQVNAEAMAALHTYGNTASNIAQTPEAKIDKLIAKVGFHTTKAKNLRRAAKICLDRHGGRVPATMEGLLALPGVGPKMAHLVLHAAFDQQEGLCIDTHIHRIANQLKWIKTNTPEKTRIALESWLPQVHWPEFNIVMVGFGQQHQQEAQKIVSRALASRSHVEALRLLSKVGLALRTDRFPELVEASQGSRAIRRLLVKRSTPGKKA